MRSFPGAARGRRALTLVVGAVLGGTLLLTPVGTPATAEPSPERLRKEQKHVHRQVERAQHVVELSSRRARAAAAALTRTQRQLAAAKADLLAEQARLTVARSTDRRMRDALAEAQARLAAARAELAMGQQAVVDGKAQLVDTVVDHYQSAGGGLSAVTGLLHARTPADMTRLDVAAETIEANADQTYDRLRASEVLLRVRTDTVAAATVEVAEQRQAAAATLSRVQQATARARESQARYAGKVAASRAAAREAQRARRADEAELARLRAREEQIRKRIVAAVRRHKQSKAHSGGYWGSVHDLLAKPVDGYVTSPFGPRRHPIFGGMRMHSGIDYGAACGTPLRASGTGRILTRYYSSSYGRRLYLDLGMVNGANLTVVYNHLSGYRARPGQRVKEGQVVGYVGTSGWSTGCHLHFEVLRNGVPVDPARFL